MRKNRKQRRRGAAMIEGALVLTVFFMMMIAIVDFGRLIWTYTTITAATREASRWAMVHGASATPVATESSVADVARQWCTGLETPLIHLNTVWTPDKKSGSTVRVSMQYDFSPIAGNLVGLGSFPLRSSSQLVITQ